MLPDLSNCSKSSRAALSCRNVGAQPQDLPVRAKNPVVVLATFQRTTTRRIASDFAGRNAVKPIFQSI
jgi:hypothetical protein